MISYGGRLPAESIPYLDVAVSILSFAFLAITLYGILILYVFLSWMIDRKALIDISPEVSFKIIILLTTVPLIGISWSYFYSVKVTTMMIMVGYFSILNIIIIQT